VLLWMSSQARSSCALYNAAVCSSIDFTPL
jgi:hypothetical protein